MIQIFTRDKSGNVDFEIDEFTKLDVILRRNDVSTWALDLPVTAPALAVAQPGMSIIVDRDGETLISGPVHQIDRTWDVNTNRLTVSGVSDDFLLWARLVYPCAPTGTPPTLFSADDYDHRTGIAETVMRAYVNANMVSGTWARTVSGLTLAPDLGRGSSVIGNGRFELVGDLLAQLALAGGDLTFGIKNLQFYVDQPQDLSTEAVFSEEIGNLVSFNYSLTAPAATHFVVGGSGDLTARAFVVGGNSTAATAWDRIEAFRDRRDTTDTTEMTQTLNTEISDKGVKTGLKIRPIDIPSLRYGADYGFDTVTAVIDGTEITDIIRQVELTYDGNGEVVAPSIESASTSGAAAVLRIFDQLRNLERRLGALERAA